MDTGKEIAIILKNLVKELHELNRTLGRMSRAPIFQKPLENTKDDPDSQ